MLFIIMLGNKNCGSYASRELAYEAIEEFVDEANYRASDFDVIEVR